MRQVIQVCAIALAVAWGLSCGAWAADGGSVVLLNSFPEPAPISTIPVIRNDRVVQLNPAELVDKTTYVIAIRCLDGATLLTESRISFRQGFQAVIESSRTLARSGTIVVLDSSRADRRRVNYRSLFVAAAGVEQLRPESGSGDPGAGQSSGSEVTPELFAALRGASRCFSFGGVQLMAYCPEATTIECEIYRQYTPAPRLMRRAGELLPEYVPSDEQPMALLGSFSAALDCPDLGYVGQDGTVYGDQPPSE